MFPPSGTPISYPGTVYSSAPPPGTPITPGTQIILSEGVANNISLGGVTRVSPMVSLPLHPLPPTSSQDHLGITRYARTLTTFRATSDPFLTAEVWW